jgi:hypothetical protein
MENIKIENKLSKFTWKDNKNTGGLTLTCTKKLLIPGTTSLRVDTGIYFKIPPGYYLITHTYPGLQEYKKTFVSSTLLEEEGNLNLTFVNPTSYPETILNEVVAEVLILPNFKRGYEEINLSE